MRWCRREGIEPIGSERRSLQWWLRQVARVAAAMLTVGVLNAASFQCCTCGTCLAIEADTVGTAWAACVATGQNSAWRVVAMRDESTGIEAAQRYDGCSKMAALIAKGFDLCTDPCKAVAVRDVVAQVAQFCHWPDGTCYALPSPLGCPTTAAQNAIPCPTPTPAPNVTPTATATPTAVPTPMNFVYTVQEFLKASDVGYTYSQGLTMEDGVVFGNGGICCPDCRTPRSLLGQTRTTNLESAFSRSTTSRTRRSTASGSARHAIVRSCTRSWASRRRTRTGTSGSSPA